MGLRDTLSRCPDQRCPEKLSLFHTRGAGDEIKNNGDYCSQFGSHKSHITLIANWLGDTTENSILQTGLCQLVQIDMIGIMALVNTFAGAILIYLEF
jgi:hypothetical protein